MSYADQHESIETKELFAEYPFGSRLGLFYYIGRNESRAQTEFVVVVKVKAEDTAFKLDGTDVTQEVMRKHFNMKGERVEAFYNGVDDDQHEWLDGHFTEKHCFDDCRTEMQQAAENTPEIFEGHSEHGIELFFMDLDELSRKRAA